MATITKLLETIVPGQYEVTLEAMQVGKAKVFNVTYGAHKKTLRGFMQALSEYESCVRHACECAGYLDD